MSEQDAVIWQKLLSALSEAQSGRVKKSFEILQEIRNNYRIERLPDVAARVICIEGICYHYSGDLQRSVDRFRIAEALAQQYGSTKTRLFAKVWMALGRYNSGNFLGTIEVLSGIFPDIRFAERDVRFRVASLITLLHYFADDAECSQAWFAIARREALASGDAYMMSALIYNVASLRVANALVSFLGDCDSRRTLSSDLLFLQSSQNYDFLVGVSNQFPLHSLLQGQCLALMGEYQSAICRFDEFLNSECQTRSSEAVKASFGRLWCQLKSGLDYGECSQYVSLLSILRDNDDLSYAHFVLSAVYDSIKDVSEAARHTELCRKYRGRFLSCRELVLSALRSADVKSVMRDWPGS